MTYTGGAYARSLFRPPPINLKEGWIAQSILEKSFRNVEKLLYPAELCAYAPVYKRILPYIAYINDEVYFARVLYEQVIGGI